MMSNRQRAFKEQVSLEKIKEMLGRGTNDKIVKKNLRHSRLSERVPEEDSSVPRTIIIEVENNKGSLGTSPASYIMNQLAVDRNVKDPTVRGLVEVCNENGAGISFLPTNRGATHPTKLLIQAVFENSATSVTGGFHLAKRLEKIPGVSSVALLKPAP